MKYLIRRLFFGRGKVRSTSMNLPETMVEAVKQVAEATGTSTATQVWIDVMDQFLVQCWQQGLIKPSVEIEKELRDASTSSEISKVRVS